MIACDQEVASTTKEPNNPFNTRLYLRLITEEYMELMTTVSNSEVVESLKEQLLELCDYGNTEYSPEIRARIADDLTDILYVTNGLGNVLGIDLDATWDEVHQSNMSKLNPDTGKADRDENNKVIKGKYYWKPKLDVVLNNARITTL